jgi:hypothetical protein
MKISSLICSVCLIFILSCSKNNDEPVPLSLHPENQHYLMFQNKPVILIGSTEHYGAVMNLDFDYIPYLDELAASGLNVTRTFTGIYVEPQSAFGIRMNSMAPKPEKFICPWPRSSEPGYANGGNKFDLSKWDKDYFTRLKDFITEAGKRNIIVELDLFSNFYDTVQWKLSPLHAANNINNVENIADHKEILSLRHPEILDIQEKMVREIISQLKDFDNLYYEICNEPYFGDTIALREWEQHMTGVVVDAEKDFKYKHLISNNVANFSRLVSEPREGVSIYNFHYAKPPVTVASNYHLNKVIGDNETGFNGIHDATYRTEAWDFILAGGGLFNHLDYSFTTDNEDGTFTIQPDQPGGGGKTLRNQFKILTGFMQSLDFIKMKPVENGIFSLPEEESAGIHGLQGSDAVYAIYIHRKDTGSYISKLRAELPEGSYTLTWTDTKSGAETVADLKDHKGNAAELLSPVYSVDIALKAWRHK